MSRLFRGWRDWSRSAKNMLEVIADAEVAWYSGQLSSDDAMCVVSEVLAFGGHARPPKINASATADSPAGASPHTTQEAP